MKENLLDLDYKPHQIETNVERRAILCNELLAPFVGIE